jgi:hypothetical protein
MENECIICLNNKTNNDTSCMLCKNKICVSCFIRIINDDNYICPFCKNNIKIDWKTLNNEIIINYFTEKEIVLKKELSILKTLNFNLNLELYEYKEKYENLLYKRFRT